jgi:hypothetical protein
VAGVATAATAAAWRRGVGSLGVGKRELVGPRRRPLARRRGSPANSPMGGAVNGYNRLCTSVSVRSIRSARSAGTCQPPSPR